MIRLAISISLVALACLSIEPASAQMGRFDFDRVDRMQAEQDQKITQALNTGKLTQGEASRLRSRMQEVASLEAQLKQSGDSLSREERRDLIGKLENINAAIDKEVNDGRFGGLGEIIGGANINSKQANIEQRIAQGVRDGSITNQEAADLRVKASRVGELENQMRVGGLSVAERERLNDELNRLNDDVHRQMRDGDTANTPGRGDAAVVTRQAELNSRIDAGLRSGKLTSAEGTRLKASAATIANLESRLRGGGLSPSERSSLNDELNRLSREIERQINDFETAQNLRNRWTPPVFNYDFGSVDRMQADQERRITEGLRSGKLSPREAERLRQKLAEVAQLESRLRRSGLAWNEARVLTDRLELIGDQIDSELNDGKFSGFFQLFSGAKIDSQQAYIDFRINEGLRNGSLTNQEATQLRSDYNRINTLEARLRAGGLSNFERDDISYELNKLSNQVYRQMHDVQTAYKPRPSTPYVGFGNRGSWAPQYDYSVSARALQEQRRKAKDAFKTGKINRRQYNNLLAKIQAVSNIEIELKNSNTGRMSWRDRLRMQDELDTLAHDVDRAINRRGGDRFNNLDAKQAGIQQVISAGVQDGSLSRREASELQNKYTRISDIETRLRASGNVLNANERDALSRELNQLSQEVYQQRHDRNRTF
ncbi:MAG: hypothetical protein K2X93_11410 [Candidatus Obscuribacterales bacterium]|nr:hypothetical protein [Candidatus Obscuribacterales bacterium]